ncbi:MAG: asparagine synthase C-terminal domain-containing protein, partial [Candidatus Eremiobacterota bacterium]
GDWEALLLEGLRASVGRMLVSDVPLGVFLSGGLDSSTLACLASERSAHIKTFSVAFSERSFDESGYARRVARALGTDHHEERLGPQALLEVLDPVVEQLDEPLGDAAILPTYLLSRYARQSVTVVLTGEGADELLAGYPTYPAHRLAERVRRSNRALVSAVRGMVARLPVSTGYMSLDFKLKRFFRHLNQEPDLRHFLWMGSYTPEDKRDLYTADLAAAIRRPTYPEFRGRGGLTLLQRIQDLDLRTYLPDDLLVKLDRATMAVSLEGRVPYLDHTLVEQLADLPDGMKLRGMIGKRVLRRAMAGRLPAEVLARPKKGFGIPVAGWLKAELKPLLDRLVEPVRLRRQGLFRPETVGRLVEEHRSGRADHRKPLWTLIMFLLWQERYLE